MHSKDRLNMSENESQTKMSKQSPPVHTKNKPYSIMVTGATGFIGSRLISELTKSGHSAVGMSRKKIENKNNCWSGLFNKDE